MAHVFGGGKPSGIFHNNNSHQQPGFSSSTVPRLAPPPRSLLNTQNSVSLYRNRTARVRDSLSFHHFFLSLRRPPTASTAVAGSSSPKPRRHYRVFQKHGQSEPATAKSGNRDLRKAAIMDQHRNASLTSITGANTTANAQTSAENPLVRKASQIPKSGQSQAGSTNVSNLQSQRESIVNQFPRSPSSIATSRLPSEPTTNDAPHASVSLTGVDNSKSDGGASNTGTFARNTRPGSLSAAAGAHESVVFPPQPHASPSFLASAGGGVMASRSTHNITGSDTEADGAQQRKAANPYAWMAETYRGDDKVKPRAYVFANPAATATPKPVADSSATKNAAPAPVATEKTAEKPTNAAADRLPATGMAREHIDEPASGKKTAPELASAIAGKTAAATPRGVAAAYSGPPVTAANSVIATPSAVAAASGLRPRTVEKLTVATTNNHNAPADAGVIVTVGETPEILEGLKAGQKYEGGIPNRIVGLISKQRNRGKGWHKRFYVLDKGFLTYSKNKQEWERGKYHGLIDVGLSIITVHRNTSKIHIDTGESLYYFRVNKDEFDSWVQCLRDHRLYRQNEVSINFTPKQQQQRQSQTPGFGRVSVGGQQQQQPTMTYNPDTFDADSDGPILLGNNSYRGPARVIQPPPTAANGYKAQVKLTQSDLVQQDAEEYSPTTSADMPLRSRDQMAKAMQAIERNAGALDAASQQIILSQDMLSRLSAILEQIEMEHSAETDFDEPLSARESAQPRTGENGGGKGLLNLFGRRTKKKKSASADQKTLGDIVVAGGGGSQPSTQASAITSTNPSASGNTLQARSSQVHIQGAAQTSPVAIDAGQKNGTHAQQPIGSSTSARVAGQSPAVNAAGAHYAASAPNTTTLPVATALAGNVTGNTGSLLLQSNASNPNLAALAANSYHLGVSPLMPASASTAGTPNLNTIRPALTVTDSISNNNGNNMYTATAAPSMLVGGTAPSPNPSSAGALSSAVHSTLLSANDALGGGKVVAGAYSVPPSPAPSDISQMNNGELPNTYKNYITMAQMLIRTLTETHGLLKAEQNRLRQQQGLLFVSGGGVGGDGASMSTLPASLLGTSASTRGSMSRVVGQLVRQNRDLRSRLDRMSVTNYGADTGTMRDATLRADRYHHELLAQSLSAGSTGSADLFFDALEGFDEDIMSENDSESSSEKSGDHESIDSELESDAEQQQQAATRAGNVAADAIAAGADRVLDSNGMPLVARTSSTTARMVADEADVTLGSAGGPLATAVAGGAGRTSANLPKTAGNAVVTPLSTMVMEPEESLTMFHARRTKLPSPRQDAGVSLWSVLKKAIGKDLSKISLPVSLNEPLGVLQRLCEELEYCDLLDRAAEHSDPLDRIMYVAAFSVSGFASGYYRSGSKPFNPLLGETYECKREDKGFQFVAEQVSHHPPVSACHASSKQYSFWQDCRVKTKFWGRSMEVSASGVVRCELNKYQEVYSWSKPSSTVLNIFSNKRSIELNGEILLVGSSGYRCKLQYTKGGSGSGHEVIGEISNPEGRLVRYVYGKWNEGLYYSEPQGGGKGKSVFVSNPSTAKELWRPGVMPEDHELYYGFSQFAIELNELQDGMEKILPITDTRFRPDQRLLECGHLDSAEEEKNRLETLQRERRMQMEAEGKHWEPKWFTKLDGVEGEENWEFNDRYWKVREQPGFRKIELPVLW